MPGSVSQAMLALVRSRLHEPDADDITDQQIYDHLSESQMVIASEEGMDAALLPLTRTYIGTWNAGTYEYPLPYDFLREQLVTVNGVKARRLELRDVDALNYDPTWEPSVNEPAYVIANASLVFYTGDEDPDTLTYEVYYVRKPMYVRAVTSIADVGGWRLTTASAHNLTADNVGDNLFYEDSDTAALWAGVGLTIGSYVDTTTLGLSGYASGAASGGRVLHPHRGQVQSTEDPLLPAIFRGPMMDWAVAKCREQYGHAQESERQKAHFRHRLETIKSRYRTGRIFDGPVGDPGIRQGVA